MRKKNVIFLLFLVLLFLLSTGCNKITLDDLSIEQKVADFNYLYNILENSYPLFEYEEKVYQLTWLENKEQYLNMIRATKNNFEFYTTMDLIFSELPSCHTMLLEPSIGSYNSLNCLLDRDIRHNLGLHFKAKCWNDYIKSFEKENRNLSNVCFEYIEGQYVLNYHSSKNINWKIPYGSVLKKINGQNVIDYYRDNPSIAWYKYDSLRNKAYKSYAIFNFDEGTEIALEIQDKSGHVSIVKAFYSPLVEEKAIWMPKEYTDIFPSSGINKKYFYVVLEDANTVYINLAKLNNPTYKNLQKDIKKIRNNENVIIDLRNNSGGNPKLFINLILSMLNEKNHEVFREYYLKDSVTNKRIMTLLKNVNISNGTVLVDNVEYYAIKENIKQEKIINNLNTNNVFILVNNRSASAADLIVNYLKTNKLATIIGTNTLGEGTSGSFASIALPNSGLVFTFMPGLSFNTDGSCNSCVGTYPDIWVEQSIEDSIKKWDLLASGQDIDDFNNILEYDTVLKYVIKSIKAD